MVEMVASLRKRHKQSLRRSRSRIERLEKRSRLDQRKHQRERAKQAKDTALGEKTLVAGLMFKAASVATELAITREMGLLAMVSESAARAFGAREFAAGGIAAALQTQVNTASTGVSNTDALSGVRRLQECNMADTSRLEHTESTREEIEEQSTPHQV
jgi:hypothetical protein